MRHDRGCGRVAKTTGVKTLDSGPVGRLSGAALLARLVGQSKVVGVWLREILLVVLPR